jgi:uncharacterized protein YecE (DUF72 family)
VRTVDWPLLMDVTSDFVYCRLHGSEVLYASGYDDLALDAWSKLALAWAAGSEPDDAVRTVPKGRGKKETRDVFIYFDNDAKVRAPFDAQRSIARVRAGDQKSRRGTESHGLTRRPGSHFRAAVELEA